MKTERVLFRIAMSAALILMIYGCLNGNSKKIDQPGPPPIDKSEMADEMIKELDHDLNLTDNQVAKIRTILKAHFDEMEAQHDKNEMPDPSEMEESFNKLHDEISKVLTEEQNEKYQLILEERKGDFNQPPRPGSRARKISMLQH